jgi:TonB family protein
VVGIEFIVNEDGTVSDVDTYIPFHPAFDKIALNAIRKSPAWKPAIRQNRKVEQGIRQPVTFQQGQE